eukprot:gene4086-5580_t
MAFALFDDGAVAQHDGALAHHAHDVKVVADEQEGEVVLATQALE